MSEFRASRLAGDARERAQQFERGERLIPVLTAIIAVLAALATLLSNHSSTRGLQARTQAGILTTKAADQYNYYEAGRIKIEVNQALIGAGLVRDPATLKHMQARIKGQDAETEGFALKQARLEEASAQDELENAERSMRSYENFEVAATLFEVSIVLISITALMRTTRPMLLVGGGATLAGIGFFLAGLLAH